MEGTRANPARLSAIARKPLASAAVQPSSIVGSSQDQPPVWQPQSSSSNPINPQDALRAQACPNICNLCKSGIPYETRYYECGFCFVFFCAGCVSQHPTSHQSSMIKKISRQTLATSIRDPRPCGECRMSTHTRHTCRVCQYSICVNCYDSASRPQHVHADYIVTEVPGKAIVGSHSQSECRDCFFRPGIAHCDGCLTAISSNDIIMTCGTCEITFDGAVGFCRKCYQENRYLHDPNHQWVSIAVQLCTDAAQKPGLFGCTQCPRRANELKDILPHHPHNLLVAYLGPNALEIVLPIVWRTCPRKPTRTDSPSAIDPNQVWACDWCSNKFPAQLPYLCRSCPDYGLCDACYPTAPYLHKHGPAAFASSQQVEASRAVRTKKPFKLGKLGIKSVDKQIEKLDKNGKLSRGLQNTGEIGGRIMLAFVKGAIIGEVNAVNASTATSYGGGGGDNSGGGAWDTIGGGGGFVMPSSDPGFTSGLQQDTWTTTSSAASDGIQGGGGSN